MLNSNQLDSGTPMDTLDLRSPLSIFFSVISAIAGFLSLESWGILIGMLCAVFTTISAVRRNRSQRRYYEAKNRAKNPRLEGD